MNAFIYHGQNLEVDPDILDVNHDELSMTVAAGKAKISDEALLDENGRTYHGYRSGSYFMPNDAKEQARLDFQHELYLLVTGGRLGHAPVQCPKHVLDVATGTGIWAIQYAERNPDCEVIGSDLSLIQKQHLAPNCKFVQQDVENEEWLFDHKFDYIHFRYIVTCFDDMRAVIQKAYDGLKPGGWIEFYDTAPLIIDLDSSVQGTAVEKWCKLLVQGGLKADKDLLKPGKYAQWCRQTGFVNVTEKRFPLPSNGVWPKDPKMKEIGRHSMINQLSLVDSLTKFITLAGLSAEETSNLEREVKDDLRNPRIHFFKEVYMIYAQKPLNGTHHVNLHE